MQKQKTKYEREYFTSKKSNYTNCLDYKIENISLVYYERVVHVLKRSVKNGAKVLDAGCAFGDLLSLLDHDQYDTYGIDVSKYALDKAKKRTKAKLVLGDLNKKLPYKDNYFEVIFALDIIEHLDSPYQFLLELKRILKKNGIVFIQTPNIGSLFEIISKDKWFGYQDETHLQLFTRKSIDFLLRKSGFTILFNQTISTPFPYLLRSILKNTDIGGNIWVVVKKK